jgi:hypothetical protein
MEKLSDDEYEFMLVCDRNSQAKTVGEILADCQLDLTGVRSLFDRQLIILSSTHRSNASDRLNLNKC